MKKQLEKSTRIAVGLNMELLAKFLLHYGVRKGTIKERGNYAEQNTDYGVNRCFSDVQRINGRTDKAGGGCILCTTKRDALGGGK